MTPRMEDDSIHRLAEDCIAANARYQREGESSPTPCFELLRQALGAMHEVALGHVYAIYLPKLEWWAAQHIATQDLGEDAEFFAAGAFERFYFAAVGDQFDAKFQALPQIIRFMQMCLLNLIREHRRKRGLPPISLADDIDILDPESPSEKLNQDDLWKKVCDLLPNPAHQQLVRLMLVLDMKPRQIIEVEEYKKKWGSVRNISMTLYRIRVILRGDDDLRNWLSE